MRDITNAIVRFSWTLPLFLMKQTLDAMTCQSCQNQRETPVADALNEVSDAARRHLGGAMEQTVGAWEQTQKVMSDALFQRTKQPATEPAPGPQRTTSGQKQGWGPVQASDY